VVPLPFDPSVMLGTQLVAITPLGSTAAIVAGHTLTVGGPGVTVAGTPMSLVPGDTLLAGTATVPLGGPGGGTVTGQSQGVGQTAGVLLGCGWAFVWMTWGCGYSGV
jgi:hypothetical protein